MLLPAPTSPPACDPSPCWSHVAMASPVAKDREMWSPEPIKPPANAAPGAFTSPVAEDRPTLLASPASPPATAPVRSSIDTGMETDALECASTTLPDAELAPTTPPATAPSTQLWGDLGVILIAPLTHTLAIFPEFKPATPLAYRGLFEEIAISSRCRSRTVPPWPIPENSPSPTKSQALSRIVRFEIVWPSPSKTPSKGVRTGDARYAFVAPPVSKSAASAKSPAGVAATSPASVARSLTSV